jgi:putative membrane protein
VGSLLVISSIMTLVPEEVGSARETLIFAARRLLRVSSNIGAVVTIVFGVLIILQEPRVLGRGWLHVKLACVLVMLGCHLWLYRRLFALENEPSSSTRREFTIVHGIISAALLVILAMVFLQPF